MKLLYWNIDADDATTKCADEIFDSKNGYTGIVISGRMRTLRKYKNTVAISRPVIICRKAEQNDFFQSDDFISMTELKNYLVCGETVKKLNFMNQLIQAEIQRELQSSTDKTRIVKFYEEVLGKYSNKSRIVFIRSLFTLAYFRQFYDRLGKI